MLALFFIVLFSIPAQEQNQNEESLLERLRACYQISDDANRLASYDQLAESFGITERESDGTGTKWTVDVKTDPMDDSKQIFFLLPTEGAGMFDEEALIIRYQSGKTELFVSWGEYPAAEIKTVFETA